jgi:hypothetical protein
MPACCIGSSAKCSDHDVADQRRITDDSTERRPRRIGGNASVAPARETLRTFGEGRAAPRAAALIRQQAQEIDALWDRLSHAYALVRRETPAEVIQKEIEALRAMLDERRSSQLKKS